MQNNRKGFIQGLIYGLLPHTFCILFILFSIIGVTASAVLFKKFLLIPNLFTFLIGLSVVFATLSALLYLRRNKALSFLEAKKRWRYLSILYSTTVLVNLLLFFVIFPNVAKLGFNSPQLAAVDLNKFSQITLEVDIPCSGHIPLIMEELKTIDGVKGVKSKIPNLFLVFYDTDKTSPSQILSLDIFKEYKATIK